MSKIHQTLLFLIALTVSACGGGGTTPTTSPPTPEPTLPNEPTEPEVPNVIRSSNATCIPPQPIFTGGSPTNEMAFPNLPAIPSVVAMVQPKNDNSFWFILNRDGRVYSFVNNPDANNHSLVLDLTNNVTVEGEMGMTGIAFHPNYANGDNRIFILYNHSQNSGQSTLSSFTVNTTTKLIDSSSEQVLFTLPQPIPYHNGGDLAFGNDGMLYASFGDTDFAIEAQNRSNLYGSLVRIDVSSYPYTIPTDNPFNNGQSLCTSYNENRTTDCPEIFAYGFRNPWRFSIDSETGIAWVGDVGENSFEEVDRVISGGNYGWPIMEGNHCTNSNSCDEHLYELPITEYGRDLGVSVVGGYVYRGSQSPSLVGQYIFGDVYRGNFFNIDANATPVSDHNILMTQYGIASMAQGNDGELYQLSFFGSDEQTKGLNVHRIIGGGGTSINMPSELNDTGCFNTTTKTLAQGVVNYDVNSELWSDGASKERAFAIPNNSKIDVLADGDFDFPEDSILIKHFLHDSKYVETRLYIHHSTGWQGYSYEWNEQQTDATLLTIGKTKSIGNYIHTFPSPTECGECHTAAANFSAGIEAKQLNIHSNTFNDNILDYLTKTDYLSSDVNSADIEPLYSITDENASLEQRARSYLHTNCSTCHRPGVINRANIDLRYTTKFSDTNTCNVAPALTGVGNSETRHILPGDPDNSTIILRMESNNSAVRMPPIARLTKDSAASTVIRAWINELNSCQ